MDTLKGTLRFVFSVLFLFFLFCVFFLADYQKNPTEIISR